MSNGTANLLHSSSQVSRYLVPGAWCLVNLHIANLGTALNAQVPVQSQGREATSNIRGWVIINNSDVKLAFRSMGEVKVNYTMESIHPAL